jgi:hypothetical protein
VALGDHGEEVERDLGGRPLGERAAGDDPAQDRDVGVVRAAVGVVEWTTASVVAQDRDPGVPTGSIFPLEQPRRPPG